MIKLKKSFAMKGKCIPFYYNDEWLTNGQFLIKRELVLNSWQYCIARANLTQPDLNRLVGSFKSSGDKVEFSITAKLWDCGDYYVREFVSPCGKSKWLKDDYVLHFGIEGFYSLPEELPVARAMDDRLMIMPCEAPV